MHALLFGRPSGLTSPKRITFSGFKRSVKPRNLERLILPSGSNRTRTRAGAIGDNGSGAILTSAPTPVEAYRYGPVTRGRSDANPSSGLR